MLPEDKPKNISDLYKENQQLRQELQDAKEKNSTLKNEIEGISAELYKLKDIISKYFTQTQIKKIVDGNVHWGEDDIVNGLLLSSISKKAYEYLRSTKKYPYPSISTLNRWVTNIKVEPGLLNSVVRMMRAKGATLTSGERACILSFDEMALSQQACYDRHADRIYGKHRYVQVVMVRGILKNWKQPVYYDYDSNIIKETVFKVLEALKEANYYVHAMVCDLGPANQKFIKDVGVTTTNPSFIDPYSKRNIHVFADAPHMLKLVRNHIIDNGIAIGDEFVSKEPLFEMVQKQKNDYKYTHRVTMKHLKVAKQDRQKVKTAAIVLSETTAQALTHMGNNKQLSSVHWGTTARFIRLIDRWFDIMNSSTIKADKYYRRPYSGTDIQKTHLEQIISIFEKVMISDKKSKFPFGIILSSKSLMNLFDDLQKIYSYKYILTRRLNQDVLENCFGALRQMGRAFVNPDPISFKYRIKKYILSHRTVMTSVGSNTKDVANDAFLATGIKAFTSFSSPVMTKLTEIDDSDEVLTSTLASNVDYTLDLPDEEDIFECNSEEEGFEYVLGYIVHRFGKKYKILKATSESPSKIRRLEGDFSCSADWIDMKNYGGLKRMDPAFIGKFRLAESVFIKVHGATGIVPGPCAVQRLLKLCSDIDLDIPTDVLSHFFRLRIHIRIKVINQNREIQTYKPKTSKNFYK